jgi:hypothetical protein
MTQHLRHWRSTSWVWPVTPRSRPNSVLTRLPPPARRTPAAASRLLAANFPHTRFLSSERTAALLSSLAGNGLAGGAVYDALVGAAAAEHELTLVTRDKRALDIYRALDVTVELLP